jgi:hypothetical protein
MTDKYCILTYSHSNCKDLWVPYVDRIKKYGPKNIEHVLMTNVNDDFMSTIQYDDGEPFSIQMLNAVELVKKHLGCKYFIYSQEDFILYDLVQESAIYDAIEQIKGGKTDFIKFIKSGGTEYCMQASIHDVDKFISFYNKYQIDSIREEGFLSRSSIGEYESKYLPNGWVGDKRGMNHYDSKVWPYMATALVKGKWNLSEYRKELTEFQQEYMVEFTNRGIY